MILSKKKLKKLIEDKLLAAGLNNDHADEMADVLVFADSRGNHSHGTIRIEYYAEQISKGGINNNPDFRFVKRSENIGIFQGDNGPGHVAAKRGMDYAIDIAKKSGVAVVGIKSISHSGSLAYYVKQAAENNMIGLSMCQSDPMAVPHGGAEPYYGTNPLAFSAPAKDGKNILFDMATTVKAWGKVLEYRARGESIPESWAVDERGVNTTDPYSVRGLLPIAGPKGYGLAMMVDIISGILLGLPFGNRVSPLYGNLSEGRNLGQTHIVINPSFFGDIDRFKQDISETINDLTNMKTAPGFDKVYYPGERSEMRELKSEEEGIEIEDSIYEYLISDDVHSNKYSKMDIFGNIKKD